MTQAEPFTYSRKTFPQVPTKRGRQLCLGTLQANEWYTDNTGYKMTGECQKRLLNHTVKERECCFSPQRTTEFNRKKAESIDPITLFSYVDRSTLLSPGELEGKSICCLVRNPKDVLAALKGLGDVEETGEGIKFQAITEIKDTELRLITHSTYTDAAARDMLDKLGFSSRENIVPSTAQQGNTVVTIEEAEAIVPSEDRTGPVKYQVAGIENSLEVSRLFAYSLAK
ncbi:MAG: hypothetical protein VW378_05485 [bacterium]